MADWCQIEVFVTVGGSFLATETSLEFVVCAACVIFVSGASD